MPTVEVDDTPTMDETLAADWAAIKGKYSTDEVEPSPVEAAPAEPAEKVEPKPERARDESGKFVKADEKAEKPADTKAEKPVEAKAPKDEPASKEEPKPEPAEKPVETGSRDVTRPPSTWKPGARAEWDKLPDAVRAEIHRRESDFMAGQSQLLPDAKLGASMRQVIEPYRLLIEAEGGTPDRAVADLMRTAAILRMGSHDQKLQAVARMSQQFGINLGQLMPRQQVGQPAPQQEFRDPRVDALLQSQQQEALNREQLERQSREAAADQWMKETDAQGNPLRPYVNDVMAEMTAMVPQIRQQKPDLSHQQVLQEAYERATWANPEVRALLQKRQQADSDERRRTENQQRVTEAKKAASVNVPRRASVPTPGKPGTMEQTIAETARALGLVSN